jgi:DNA-binding transcriptional regulator YhcF (GntR family)
MFEINFSQQSSKVKQLADAIQKLISIGVLSCGDLLPTIHGLSKRCCVARNVVCKAYLSLKASGIIASTPTEGYSVAPSITQILVMFDIFSRYKNDMYHALTNNLPSNYKVDLSFHHYNKAFFETIIRDSVGRYNLYTIMNFCNDCYSQVQEELDHNRVLLLDFGIFEKEGKACF